MNKRISSIELLRFVMMSIIVVWHSFGQAVFKHGYLPVDFFFILSGVFIYEAVTRKNTPPSPSEFTIRKIRKFLPKYLLALVFAFFVIILFRNWFYGNSLLDAISIFRVISEGFMLQEVGLFPRGINGPVWYLSVLIVGGGLLYTFAYHSKKFLSCIAPCIVLFGYTFLVNETNGNFDEFYTVGFMRLPLLRGVCGMSLGMLIGTFSKKQDSLMRPALIDFLCLLSFVGMVFCLCGETHLDMYFCLFSAIAVFTCLLPNSWINKAIHHEIFNRLGNITYDMLLLHFPINILWHHSIGIHFAPQLSVFLCLIVNVIIAWLFNFLFKKMNLNLL